MAMNIRENVPISKLTTMRLGGAARFVIEIWQESDLPKAYAFAKEKCLPVYVLGGGSNIVGRDGGYNGVILVNHLLGMGKGEESDDKIQMWAASGEALDDFVRYSTKYGWSGMEALSAIPGTVGAAPVQNVGAYGQEISDTLVNIDVYDVKANSFVNLSKDQLGLSYRRSILNYGELVGRYFVTKITVELSRKQLQPPFYNSLQRYIDERGIDEYTPENIRKAVRAVRSSKLPDPDFIASSGSFFKNVYLDEEQSKVAEAKGIQVWDGGKVPAGWLLENAGLKGRVLHGMRVWDHASLVLVNESAKGYSDLAAARSEIIEIVKEKYGLTLEQEPMELGE